MVFLVPALHPAMEAGRALYLCTAVSLLALFHELVYTGEERLGPEHSRSPHPSFSRGPESLHLRRRPSPAVQCGAESAVVFCWPMTSSRTLLLGEKWHDHGLYVTQRKPCFYNMPECSSLPSDSVPAALCSEKVEAEHLFVTDGD